VNAWRPLLRLAWRDVRRRPLRTTLVALLIAFGVAGNGEAVILSATSRVWLTVLEVVPGIISLFWLPPSQRAALRQSG